MLSSGSRLKVLIYLDIEWYPSFERKEKKSKTLDEKSAETKSLGNGFPPMDLPFVSNETSNWLLYILTDSALPTGGFVASSGLEASQQAGLLNAENLADFVTSASHSYANNSICFVRAGYEAPDHSDPLAALTEYDAECDAVMVANTVGRRASLAQGVAMIILYLKCFADNPPKGLDITIMRRWKTYIRGEKVNGHFPICFGLVCRFLGVDRGK